MKRALLIIAILLYAIAVPSTVHADDKKTEKQKVLSVDGPYVFHLPDGRMRVISVDGDRRIVDTVYAAVPEDFTLTVTPHKYGHPFQVKLQTPERPAWKMKAAEKTLVLSDPHGDLHSFISILRAQQVIDDDYNWIYGKNQLVVIGDVFDRGKDVTAIFWLLYKLEQEARAAGGEALFLLGNHEEMILRGNVRYAKDKYKNLADTLKIPYQSLYGESSELGRWLRTRNLLEVIGNNLFVHAGLSVEFMGRKESFAEMNEVASRGLSLSQEGRKNASPLSAFIFDTKTGPFWFRGMVKPDEKFAYVTPATVKRMLKKYKVGRIFVGHTIFKEVTPFYDGKVIAVNVKNEDNRKENRSRGVLIDKGKLFLVYDKKTSSYFNNN